MPCNSEYMNPSEAETNSRRTAKLLRYVYTKLGWRIPDEVHLAAENYYGNVSKLNDFVIRLCTACGGMTKDEEKRIIYDGREARARDLADWWDEHQAADRKREAKERKAKQMEKAYKSAMKKLTTLEKQALNIK
jgi:hypothetical protein